MSTPVLPQTPKITPTSWTNSDSANTEKTLFTAGGSGAKVVGIIGTSTDSSARIFDIRVNRSSTSYKIGAQTIATTAGTDGATQSSNLLGLMPGLPIDNDGQPYLFLENGDVLKGNNQSQVSSAKEVDIIVIAANF